MEQSDGGSWVAFAGSRRISAGPPAQVALATKAAIDGGERSPVIIVDGEGRVVDVDFRGTDADVLERLGLATGAKDAAGDGADASPYSERLTPRGRGRPRLGVVAREVTLLPRHWDWLATQPGGASAAVRRLVDEARHASASKDRARHATESAYRFMSAIAGDEPGFEEATRALFAGDEARFVAMTAEWPSDVRDHARLLAHRALGSSIAGA
jgi:hypothetical protein